jgi:cobalt-zinc-cadmium efflux system outer membrane protein
MNSKPCRAAVCLLGLLPVVAVAKPIAFANGTTVMAAAGVGVAPAETPEPLGLNDAVGLAEAQAPQLAAQQAAISAAGAEAVRAPELPDPQLIAGIDNLPVDTADRFNLTHDFMTMRKIGVVQAFPRKEKRRLRGERAEAKVATETARLTAQSLDVSRQTALAWVDRYVAERERSLIETLRPELDVQARTAEAVFRGGTGHAADVLAAQSAKAQLEDRLDDVDRQSAQAEVTLARWIGAEAAARPLGEPPDFTTLPQSPARLLEHVGHHGALLPYAAMETEAEADIALARVEKKPDWSLEVAYAQRGPDFSNMLTVEVHVDLPLFAAHRQDPHIAAKQAELEKVQAERANAERMHREDTAKTLAAWQAADKRAHRYEKELLPLAEQRAQVALAAYGGGQGDIQPVLSARTAEIESRLAYGDQLHERARAWAELRFLLPEEDSP